MIKKETSVKKRPATASRKAVIKTETSVKKESATASRKAVIKKNLSVKKKSTVRKEVAIKNESEVIQSRRDLINNDYYDIFCSYLEEKQFHHINFFLFFYLDISSI